MLVNVTGRVAIFHRAQIRVFHRKVLAGMRSQGVQRIHRAFRGRLGKLQNQSLQFFMVRVQFRVAED